MNEEYKTLLDQVYHEHSLTEASGQSSLRFLFIKKHVDLNCTHPSGHADIPETLILTFQSFNI